MAADDESTDGNLSGPKPIRRLEEAVINRIAAGEVHSAADVAPNRTERFPDYT